MLSCFSVKSTFYNVKASIWVDCERKESHITMTVSGRIHHMQKLHFHECDTVEKAEAYLRHDCGALGTFMEYYYHLHGRSAA